MSEEELLFKEIFEEEPTTALPPLIRKLCKTFEKFVFKSNSGVEDYSVYPDKTNCKIVFSVDYDGEKFKVATIVNNNTLSIEKVVCQEIIDVDMKTVNKCVSVIKKKINDMKDYYGLYGTGVGE